ncbi:MAG: methionyl-tRNA formyltransferase [Spirochaetia bacterium]
MRILFAGTPEFAVQPLEFLSDVFPVVGVLTAPAKPRGRGRKPVPAPVAVAAERLGIHVLTPQRLGAEARREVSALQPDILVCVAYGRIFGPRFLDLFPKGGINLHPSLLPRHRGPAPIPAAILSGDRKTGITVQRLALEMDSGDILLQEELELDGTETTASLTEAVSRRGGPLLAEVLRRIADGSVVAREQEHGEATWCGLIQSSDAEIDWSEPAEIIDRKVRAYNPWPKAHTWFRGKRIAVLEAKVVDRSGGAPGSDARGLPQRDSARPGTIVGIDSSTGILVQTGTGLLSLLAVQPQNKSVMSSRDYINGVGDITGEAFDQSAVTS